MTQYDEIRRGVLTSASQRMAHRSDTSMILTVLTDVSAEIPLRLDGQERETRIRTLVDESCDAHLAWVSLNGNGRVVGVLIGTRFPVPTVFDGVEIKYAGVSVNYRKQGRLAQMLGEAKRIKCLLRAEVSRSNTGDMAVQLMKNGFIKQQQAIHPNVDDFVWSP